MRYRKGMKRGSYSAEDVVQRHSIDKGLVNILKVFSLHYHFNVVVGVDNQEWLDVLTSFRYFDQVVLAVHSLDLSVERTVALWFSRPGVRVLVFVVILFQAPYLELQAAFGGVV